MAEETYKMPLGKYKGEPIREVPTGYLDWLIGQDWLQYHTKKKITEHLETRADWHRMDDDE